VRQLKSCEAELGDLKAEPLRGGRASAPTARPSRQLALTRHVAFRVILRNAPLSHGFAVPALLMRRMPRESVTTRAGMRR
jgi:hypothetical protein